MWVHQETDGQTKNYEDGTSLDGLYFVPADDGNSADKKANIQHKLERIK